MADEAVTVPFGASSSITRAEPTMANWKQPRAITGTHQPHAAAPEVDTVELIDAVLGGRPTAGGPGHLATRVPRQRADGPHDADGSGPRLDAPVSRGVGAKVGAAVTTTAGKIVLCAAVAAASVGGVYATDAVEYPWDSGPAASTATAPTDVETSTTTTSTTTSTTLSTTSTTSPPVVAPPPAPVEESVDPAPAQEAPVATEEPAASTGADGLTGCAHGQATAGEASGNASGSRQNPERDHDPCSANADDDRGNADDDGGRGGPPPSAPRGRPDKG